jgi:hypothetical protein
VFYKQISDEQKNAIASVVVPITKSYSKNRFTSERLYYYTKKLGGKYILYVEDRRNLDWDWNDDTPSYDKFDTYFVRKDEYCPGF